MAYLKFYREEWVRWKAIGVIPMKDSYQMWADVVCARFGAGRVRIEFGRRNGGAWYRHLGCIVKFTEGQVNWLLFAHELAHHIDYKRRGRSRHDKFLAGIVDEICVALIDMVPELRERLTIQMSVPDGTPMESVSPSVAQPGNSHVVTLDGRPVLFIKAA
jgi:hypothetical protein